MTKLRIFIIFWLIFSISAFVAEKAESRGKSPGATTTGPSSAFSEGSLLRAKGTTPIYVIEKGKKRWIPNLETFEAKGFRFAAIKEIEPDQLAKIPSGDPLVLPKPIIRSPSDVKEGMLIRASGSAPVYVIKNGKKSWIPNPQTFEALGYKWNQVVDLKKNIFDKIPLGSPLPSLKPGRP
jgi:hypothetical protein